MGELKRTAESYVLFFMLGLLIAMIFMMTVDWAVPNGDQRLIDGEVYEYTVVEEQGGWYRLDGPYELDDVTVVVENGAEKAGG